MACEAIPARLVAQALLRGSIHAGFVKGGAPMVNSNLLWGGRPLLFLIGAVLSMIGRLLVGCMDIKSDDHTQWTTLLTSLRRRRGLR